LDKAQIAIEGLDRRAYTAKPPMYFQGARPDYVSALPANSQARILEIGCGEGGTGYLALKEGRCRTYCGVELMPSAAEKAKQRITEVVIGNIEEIGLPWASDSFDALILSEVLEHLVDPWALLKKMWPLLKPGGMVFASSPNVSNHRIIRMLLRGEWNLTEMGVMDKTHLRWFTPHSYQAMFESCGYVVDSVGPGGTLSLKAKLLSALTLGWLRNFFIMQIDLRAHRPELRPGETHGKEE
jgi:2-polyprenyl-3-methyl-5-hydroxy-6-metoxy-1,4-benzoquinol methylase